MPRVKGGKCLRIFSQHLDMPAFDIPLLNTARISKTIGYCRYSSIDRLQGLHVTGFKTNARGLAPESSPCKVMWCRTFQTFEKAQHHGRPDAECKLYRQWMIRNNRIDSTISHEVV